MKFLITLNELFRLKFFHDPSDATFPFKKKDSLSEANELFQLYKIDGPTKGQVKHKNTLRSARAKDVAQ